MPNNDHAYFSINEFCSPFLKIFSASQLQKSLPKTVIMPSPYKYLVSSPFTLPTFQLFPLHVHYFLFQSHFSFSLHSTFSLFHSLPSSLHALSALHLSTYPLSTLSINFLLHFYTSQSNYSYCKQTQYESNN